MSYILYQASDIAIASAIAEYYLLSFLRVPLTFKAALLRIKRSDIHFAVDSYI